MIEQDIPRFAELTVSMAEKLKTLLYIVAQSVPFKPNYTKIARDIDTNRNVVSDLVVWLEKAGLINILRDESNGIKLLGKVNKIYLTTLILPMPCRMKFRTLAISVKLFS